MMHVSEAATNALAGTLESMAIAIDEINEVIASNPVLTDAEVALLRRAAHNIELRMVPLQARQ